MIGVERAVRNQAECLAGTTSLRLDLASDGLRVQLLVKSTVEGMGIGWIAVVEEAE